MDFGNWLPALWFVAAVALMLAELAVPGFIIFFFGLGALAVSGATLLFDLSWTAQALLFAAGSLVSLAVGRRWCKRFLPNSSSVGTDDADDKGLVGALAVVTEPIAPPRPGRVEVQGSTWKAVSDAPQAAGAQVTIVRCDNITLTVR